MQMAYFVFCDGACSGNPGPGGWGSIIQTPEQNIIELGGSERPSTNNRMEMRAALEAIKWINLSYNQESSQDQKKIIKIYTDSSYLIKGMTEWITGWQRRGWKNSEGKAVANQDLWNELLTASSMANLQWFHVRGHQGHLGNERADEIAVSFTKNYNIQLFKGSKQDYSIKLDA